MSDFKKIDERTFDFALLIVETYRFLIRKNEFVLSKQLLESGTSIGANVQEAQAGQSKKDFMSKMAIASKEARETDYWLRLLNKSGYLSSFDKKEVLFSEINAIVNILTKIVKTSKENIKRSATHHSTHST
jgi:four helix bundle protein